MSEKFTVEQKAQIVIESFTATNIAELCRKHGVSVAQFHRWKERFLEAGKRGIGETSKGNQYEKEIDDLKRLIGDQALVISALKKSQGGRKG
jgi:transposase